MSRLELPPPDRRWPGGLFLAFALVLFIGMAVAYVLRWPPGS